MYVIYDLQHLTTSFVKKVVKHYFRIRVNNKENTGKVCNIVSNVCQDINALIPWTSFQSVVRSSSLSMKVWRAYKPGA